MSLMNTVYALIVSSIKRSQNRPKEPRNKRSPPSDPEIFIFPSSPACREHRARTEKARRFFRGTMACLPGSIFNESTFHRNRLKVFEPSKWIALVTNPPLPVAAALVSPGVLLGLSLTLLSSQKIPASNVLLPSVNSCRRSSSSFVYPCTLLLRFSLKWPPLEHNRLHRGMCLRY